MLVTGLRLISLSVPLTMTNKAYAQVALYMVHKMQESSLYAYIGYMLDITINAQLTVVLSSWNRQQCNEVLGTLFFFMSQVSISLLDNVQGPNLTTFLGDLLLRGWLSHNIECITENTKTYKNGETYLGSFRLLM